MLSDKFPRVMYRGDGTELVYEFQWYPEHQQWWIGYFDHEKCGWVSKLTARNTDQYSAEKSLHQLLDSEDVKKLYFTEKPSSHTGYIYDKSVME